MSRRLVLWLLLGCLLLLPGKAQAFVDTTGTEHEAAVAVLTRIGLVKGFPDDTFRPGLPITRAEFTALIVRARGLESAARFVAGVTPYPDVGASHWASGYVNIAADYGLVRGYPDGTFRPGATISYGEALIMLVRVLGCEDQIVGTGISGYLALAEELGIAAVRLDQHSTPATRGVIAQFAYRSLSVPLGHPPVSTFPRTGDTLFDGLPGVTRRTGVITDTWLRPDSELAPPRVALAWGGTAQNLALLDRALGVGLLGREVRAWTVGTDLVGLVSLTQDSQVISGEVAAAIVVDGRLSSLTIAGRQYQLAADPVLYRNYQRVAPADRPADWSGGSATAILDPAGAIRYLDAVTFEGSWVVADSDPHAQALRVVDNGGRIQSVSLREYREVTAVVGGATVSPYSLPRGTVVHYFSRPPARLYLEVRTTTRRLFVDGFTLVGDRILIRAGGREHPAPLATVSLDGDHTFSALSPLDLVTAFGHPVTLHIDHAGRVRHVSARVVDAPPWTRLAMVTTSLHRTPAGLTLSVVDSLGIGRDLLLGATTIIRWGPEVDTVGQMSADDVARASTRLDRGVLVRLTLAADGSVRSLESTGWDAEPAELVPGSPGTSDAMVRVAQRWTRIRPDGHLFVDDDRFARALSSWSLGEATGSWATAWRSSAAVTEALTLNIMPPQLGPAAAGDHGIVVGWKGEERSTLVVETGTGLRTVVLSTVTVQARTGINTGEETSSWDSLRPGDYILLTRGSRGLVLLEPLATTATVVSATKPTVTAVTAQGVRTWLVSHDVAVIQARGIRHVAPYNLAVGMKVDLLDHDHDGVIDVVIIRSGP